MSPETINAINAASTVVVAAATVALTWVAFVQIRHRNQDKTEQQNRLGAVAKHHGLLVQRALIDAVTALDALRVHSRHLATWSDQARTAHHFLVKARRELDIVMQAMIERHAGTPAAIEEMLRATLAALVAARELAGPTAPALSEEQIVQHYQEARKQALVVLSRLQAELALPESQPLFQPTKAPGALKP
jgi:hypothetical protein